MWTTVCVPILPIARRLLSSSQGKLDEELDDGHPSVTAAPCRTLSFCFSEVDNRRPNAHLE